MDEKKIRWANEQQATQRKEEASEKKILKSATQNMNKKKNVKKNDYTRIIYGYLQALHFCRYFISRLPLSSADGFGVFI